MVDAVEMEKDIRAIAEKVGTAVFTYDEIHNENVNNLFHYDYKRVIDEVSRLNGKDMTKDLIERGVLRPLAYGEYAVDVGGSTRNGGGLNYQGKAFFSLSNLTEEDFRVKYHELAHSLQDYYRLFDDTKMQTMYAQDSTGNKDKDAKSQINKDEYRDYLNEMHSECFAYAALMLRAKTKTDFIKQAAKAYKITLRRYMAAVLDTNKKYPGSKYYATYPVIRAMIRNIRDIRKNGRQREFFDENGVLNDEKLAKLSESIVIKNAYSPRTMKSFFDYKITDNISLQKNDWRRDSAKVLIATPVIFMQLKFDKSFGNSTKHTIKQIKKHWQLVKKENEILTDFFKTEQNPENKQLKALYSYARIQAGITLLDKKYPNEHIRKTFSDIVANTVQNNYIPENIILSYRDRFNTMSGSLFFPQDAEELLRIINKQVQENKDNPYFKEFANKECDYATLWKMIQDKQQNPDKDVIAAANLQPKEKNYGYASLPVKNSVAQIVEFADKWDKSGKLKDYMLTKLTEWPEFFFRQEMKDCAFSIAKSHISPLKRKKFKRELKTVLDNQARLYWTNNRNPQYLKMLELLAQVPTDKIKTFSEKMYNAETAAYQKSQEEKEAAKEKARQEKINQMLQDVKKIVQEQKKSAQVQQAQEKVAEPVKPAEKVTEQQQSLSVKSEQLLYEQMKKLVDFANRHNPEQSLSGELLRTFVQEPQKMFEFEFWSKTAFTAAETSPYGATAVTQELGALIPHLCKEIKTNENNPAYQTSRVRLVTFYQEQVSCPSADEVLKKSQQLATTTKTAEPEQPKTSSQITLAVRQKQSAGH